MIQYGDSDVMVAGSSEACITPLSLTGFSRIRALAPNLESSLSCPFDANRNGFVMGEGCGIIVLEEFNHAINRNANIYAEVVGYGMSSDAFHITNPPPNGLGAQRAMLRACNDAKIEPCSVDYINAHATSTPVGDLSECKAIQTIFNQNTLVSSTKGSTGHLLGASGSVEALFTILALKTGQIPPNLNLKTISPGMELNYVTSSFEKDMVYTMSNSFGFGGSNCSLIFKKFEPRS